MINPFKVILLITLLCAVSSQSNAGEPKRMNKEAISTQRYAERSLRKIQASTKSAPEEAITKLDGLIRYCIQNDETNVLADAYTLNGEAYLLLNQPQLALHFLKLALTASAKREISLKGIKHAAPRVTDELLAKLGYAHAALGNYNESSEFFERALAPVIDKTDTKTTPLSQLKQAKPSDYFDWKFRIGQNLYDDQRFKEAIDYFEKLQSSTDETHTDEINTMLAACHISAGNIETGINLYKAATEEPSNEAEYQQSQSIVSKALRSQNKFKEDAEIRNQTLNANGGANAVGDGLQYLRLAQAYWADSNKTEAITAIDTYLSTINYNLIDASEIEFIKEASAALKATGDYQKAFLYLQTYQQLNDSIDAQLTALKNRASSIGAVGFDNILKLEKLQQEKNLSNSTINHLMREGELQEEALDAQSTAIYSLVGLILIGLFALFYILRVSKQRRIANQQLALRSLRSQMNPHFIFNALNSVNSFISISDERSANKFLAEFSRLMRTVMENSEHDFIPLSKELEIVRIYMELEHFRFKDKFNYELNIDPEMDEEALVLPPMLIQPYIENAIWHGLRYKEDTGLLSVSISNADSGLTIKVHDNGIGRVKSAELKTKNQQKNKSTALKNIKERIQIFNDLHGIQVTAIIEDHTGEKTGTTVTLTIPQPHEKN